MFIECRSAEDAATAIEAMNNHPFDSKHTFKVNKFTDVETYADLNEEYVEPPTIEYKTKVRFLYVCFRISFSI
jgi:translation initiation factor 3 subunit B